MPKPAPRQYVFNPAILLIATLVASTTGSANASWWDDLSPEASLSAVGYARLQHPDESARFNPDNRVYRIPRQQFRAELRPEINMQLGSASLELSPRIWAEQSRLSASGISDTHQSYRGRLQYAKLQYDTEESSFMMGRYVNFWGPSLFVAPSAPFHLNSGQITPQLELAARDYLEFSHQLDAEYNLSIIANIGRGNQNVADFRKSLLARLEYTGDAVSSSLLLQYQAGGRFALGANGQWTLNDAWLLYWDGMWRQGRYLQAYPHAETGVLGPDDSRAGTVDLLLGGAYSLEDGTTFGVDLYRHGSGLSDSERQTAFSMVSLSAPPFSTPVTGRSLQNIQALSSVPLSQLGRHYMMFRLQRQNLWDQVNLGLLHILNLDDRSSQMTLNAEWSATDQLQLFAYASWMNGASDTEYGRFVEHQLIAGVRWTPW